ncbi:hypothetical protein So717_21500 [Roseobacter cerasinus]|uniref:Twin-arginine translocation pathway signal n=1 Tax=Roseobacter cerasinus TaxID=2602289 RepID=A0A640VRI1_9RHOB|nr:DUF1513 domain-containing protein [Roseobacter cerasinus]GFE50397.1 hypothetical protein So717_21500 [Roseobacter cerasinus]
MPSRRSFLAGLLASGMTAELSWADAGGPSHLSAAMTPGGDYVLVGLRPGGELAFSQPLPGRGHAAVAHPARPEAVAFARRPGTYALVIDCVSGAVLHALAAPAGHHFYGHGAFSADGTLLFTTENHIASGQGRVGVWAREDGYARVGGRPSGGIGPHEMLRLPGRKLLAVANGGILTRPETGREKLNLDIMRPNLTLMTEAGDITEQAALPDGLNRSSLRHIAGFADGSIACGFQWEGDPYDGPALVALYKDGSLRLLDSPEDAVRSLDAYVGSVAALSDGKIAVTSPRGGVVQVFDPTLGFLVQSLQADVCGVAASGGAGLATDGLGGVHHVGERLQRIGQHNLAFDNHLVAI